MVYLSDVDEKNGCFEILEGSHKLSNIITDIKIAKFKFNQNRISENQIERLLNKKKYRGTKLVGKAGTLVLFNTSAIHRGHPLIEGERVALTTYYYANTIINEDLFRQFNI